MQASAVTLLFSALAGSHSLAAGRGWLWGGGWVLFLLALVLVSFALLWIATSHRPIQQRQRISRPQQRRRRR